MSPPRLLVAVLALVLPAGCIEGEDRFFPDEGREVVRLHVNAYATPPDDPTGATVEVRGMGDDGRARAFAGSLSLELARQHVTDAGPTYEAVGSWAVHVVVGDFSSPTEPLYLHPIPGSLLEKGDTYRVHVTGATGGRDLDAAWALFGYPDASG